MVWFKQHRYFLLAFAWLWLAQPFGQMVFAQSESVKPYTVDAHTLHLYHFDESKGRIPDVASDDRRFQLELRGGAVICPTTFAGFGRSIDTHVGEKAGAYVRERVSTATFRNRDTGAFTIEMLVCMGFDPNAVMFGRPDRLKMMGMESDGGTRSRPFQFAMRPIGTMGALAPTLEFMNIAGASGVQLILAVLPNTGPHVPQRDQWFHAAVTYDGAEDTEGNLKFYWTRLDVGATEANLIHAARMTSDLSSKTGKLCIGNTAKKTSRICNWLGLIDEVRISDIARSPQDFLFGKGANDKAEAAFAPGADSNSSGTAGR